MYCPGCHKKLDTSLTSCNRCGSLQLGLGQSIPRAEHDRIVAEKDAEIVRLREAVVRARNYIHGGMFDRTLPVIRQLDEAMGGERG